MLNNDLVNDIIRYGSSEFPTMLKSIKDNLIVLHRQNSDSLQDYYNCSLNLIIYDAPHVDYCNIHSISDDLVSKMLISLSGSNVPPTVNFLSPIMKLISNVNELAVNGTLMLNSAQGIIVTSGVGALLMLGYSNRESISSWISIIVAKVMNEDMPSNTSTIWNSHFVDWIKDILYNIINGDYLSSTEVADMIEN
jgi:hypothetical protein